ncbi:copper resistance protein CopZ [Paramesorhizobium deserti]|uniref:Copper resistance protein CopZ n=1 Tax=Paramesorhizobium deserti TaxID=1494590 RepID=A0A135HSC2_9HYPH|nr:nitrous oxide reductase accessory protein NosL [Paramesorhizobium deserti]KXF76086.1 copper resistance protein CopZ [Paramesorhizobium deserti]
MKRFLLAVAMAALTLSLQACQREADAPPTPFSLTEEALGHYCGMNVLEHPGPKGQAIVASFEHPIWFSSARDAIAFTMLPEEAKDIRGVFVSDMANAPSWEEPGPDNWVDASKAFFVIASEVKGGMGADEAVPFSTEAAAKAFSQQHGGLVVTLAEIPRNYILGSGSEMETSMSTTTTGREEM